MPTNSKEYAEKYRKANAARIKAHSLAYYEKNKKRIRRYQRQYQRLTKIVCKFPADTRLPDFFAMLGSVVGNDVTSGWLQLIRVEIRMRIGRGSQANRKVWQEWTLRFKPLQENNGELPLVLDGQEVSYKGLVKWLNERAI